MTIQMTQTTILQALNHDQGHPRMPTQMMEMLGLRLPFL